LSIIGAGAGERWWSILGGEGRGCARLCSSVRWY